MILKSFVVPGLPHPLLAPEKSPAWGRLRKAFDQAQKEIAALKPELIVIFSTQWVSVIGHQIQADPEPEFVHVDPEFHELGSMPYKFKMDAEFANAYRELAQKRGLHARTVAYKGFPIDTGAVVALKLLNPQNIPATIVSCNMYSDRAETVILGKAAKDAIEKLNKRTVAIGVTGFSYRFFTEPIDPKADRIYSLKDDEWNRKILEILGEGRLEDVSQLAREFTAQASADSKMKAIWWLAGLMGQNNKYEAKVFDYQPICGTGAAVVSLTPSEKTDLKREYDEEDSEVFKGYDSVFGSTPSTPPTEMPAHAAPPPTQKPMVAPSAKRPPSSSNENIIQSPRAPKPVGAYPHARREGDLLFLSGIGPRDPKTNEIPGGPVKNLKGEKLNYDIELQTRAVIENIKTILQDSGSSLEKVIDIAVYLIDMDRDFTTFNKVYGEYFGHVNATRTTVAVTALPTPIAVELKVIAKP